MPNLTWIANKFFPGVKPRQINAGSCYNWALKAYLHYNNVKLFTIEDCGGHAFAKIGRFYYDAQNPQGVLHWSSLDLLREVCRDNIYSIMPWRQSLQVFLQYWRENGRYPVMEIKRCIG